MSELKLRPPKEQNSFARCEVVPSRQLQEFHPSDTASKFVAQRELHNARVGEKAGIVTEATAAAETQLAGE